MGERSSPWGTCERPRRGFYVRTLTGLVRLFGPDARSVGEAQVEVELDNASTCAELRNELGAKYPSLKGSLDHARFAVNGEFAEDSRVIEASDEIALIGLVSGG